MSEKLKLTQAVVVEGKYDKLKLSQLLDAFIIETNGFGVFKDKERLAFIKKLARERGVIVLTDSDHAGFMIRRYIASGIPKEQLTQVYIPDVYGKEKRKQQPSKEGKLGVEGMTREVLLKAFQRAGVAFEAVQQENPVTQYDLYAAGLSGTSNARQNKKKLLKALDLPEFLSTHALLSCLNNMMTREEFLRLLEDNKRA
ncbi:MAG: DUF4093 domain-containing protein [Eubacterium sp.]|nr:DUF4093 domain-containing protein [Eubacterium sp.]